MNWRVIRRRLGPVVLGLVIGGLSLCNHGVAKAFDSEAAAAATLTIGVADDEPGLSTLGPDGHPVGFAVDVGSYIARALGVTPDHITWKATAPDQLDGLVTAGTADLALESSSATPQRRKSVAFAGPYLVAGQDLLVRADNTDITRPESLNGKSVCAAAGASDGQQIRRYFAPSVQVVALPSYPACVDSLLAGDIDAVTADDVLLAGYAAEHPGKLRVVGHPITREHYRVALRSGDILRQDKVTSAIANMVADGTWRQSVDRYLSASGFQPMPAPSVFNAPDVPFNAIDGHRPDPAAATAIGRLATTWNAGDWVGFNALLAPDTRAAINKMIQQYTPNYDTNLGPDADPVGLAVTINDSVQTSGTAAMFQAHETFTHVPAKYQNYFRDIDYVGAMTKIDNQWQVQYLAADFSG